MHLHGAAGTPVLQHWQPPLSGDVFARLECGQTRQPQPGHG
ncbi:hypothetical protein ACEP1V_24045 [Pseudomonas aeruginosa]